MMPVALVIRSSLSCRYTIGVDSAWSQIQLAYVCRRLYVDIVYKQADGTRVPAFMCVCVCVRKAIAAAWGMDRNVVCSFDVYVCEHKNDAFNRNHLKAHAFIPFVCMCVWIYATMYHLFAHKYIDK